MKLLFITLDSYFKIPFIKFFLYVKLNLWGGFHEEFFQEY